MAESGCVRERMNVSVRRPANVMEEKKSVEWTRLGGLELVAWSRGKRNPEGEKRNII